MDPDETRMTLGEHLEELRVRLIRSTLAVLVAFLGAWFFRETLDGWVQRPYHHAAVRLNAELEERATAAIAASPAPLEEAQEWYEPGYPERKVLRYDKRIPEVMKGDFAAAGFFYYMKMCFYFALFVGGPVVLWEMWQFVAAGLYRHEKSIVHQYFPLSLGLFVGGVLFGYFVMVPNALYFLALQTLAKIQWFQSIDSYWTLLVGLTLALGAVFQLPVLMMALARLDLVQPATFAKYRGHMLVGALVVAAVLTPPDPFTQMLMAIPIAVLYEAGIWISRMVHRPAPVEG